MNNRKKVYVGLSGGVDSSVTALLLQNQGYDVVGVYMKNFDPLLFGEEFSEQCHWLEDQEDAREIAKQLGIEFKIWNFEKEYYSQVIDYFFEGYAKGETPNPDVMCNRYIKFNVFLKKAIGEGADYIATGHYARLRQKRQILNFGFLQKSKIKNSIKNELEFLRGKDKNKDQSYFLWTLTQEQLKYVLFPLGDMDKSEVRKIASQYNLTTAKKPDSQGICFVGEIDITRLLKTRLPERRGKIVTTDGEDIGEHNGAYFYTEGQRKGLGIGGGIPYFVTTRDMKKNIVTVAKGFNNKNLYSASLEASSMSWVSDSDQGLPVKCEAQIRYRQKAQPCLVSKSDKHGITVDFKEPQRAVTSGQSVVLYKGDLMLGGGIIV